MYESLRVCNFSLIRRPPFSFPKTVTTTYIHRICTNLPCNLCAFATQPSRLTMKTSETILQPPMSEIEFNIKHRAVHRNVAVFMATFYLHLHYELA